MFFAGTPNISEPSDSVFMLFKCTCNNVSTEKRIFEQNSPENFTYKRLDNSV